MLMAIVAYQPPHHLAVHGTIGKQRQSGSYTRAAAPEGTVVTATNEMPSSPFDLPFHPLYRSLLHPQTRAALTRLKRVLEDSAR